MKKFQFAVLALAAVCMIACDKKKDEPKPQPEPTPEPSYVCPITIDGTGAEYDALPNVVISKCNEECGNWQGLKVMKVYSDEVYTCIYLEYDAEEFPLSLGKEDEEAGAQIHLYTSDDLSKDGFIAQTAQPLHWCYEGAFVDPGAALVDAISFEGFVWPEGEPTSAGWPWVAVDGAANPVAETKVTDKAIEMKLNTPSILGATGSFFYMAIDLQDSWESVGVLPNEADDVDEEEGTVTPVLADPVKVVINTVE